MERIDLLRIFIILLLLVLSIEFENFINNMERSNPLSSTQQTVETSKVQLTEEETREYALKQAKLYSRLGRYRSKKNVYNSLIAYNPLTNFTIEEAQYAIDNVDVDWKENARKCAEQYYNLGYKSKKSIYNRLVYSDGFTIEEAQYAIDNLKL